MIQMRHNKYTGKGLGLSGLAVAALTLASCVRDELPPCPPLEIRLEVTDKNYINVRAAARMGLEEIRRTDLPFKAYVEDLAYRVTCLETGKVVAEQAPCPVEGEAETLDLTLPEDLPYGTYVLTAWGNLGEETNPEEGLAALELHPGGSESSDAYFTTDTLRYDYGHAAYTCGMERTKGKLIVHVKEMPDEYRFSAKKITEIFTRREAATGYRNPAELSFGTRWAEGGEIRTKTVLGPSTDEKASALDFRFYVGETDEGNDNWIAPEQVSVTMRRNELTVLRYEYDPCCCRFKIYILVNDNWETLHTMEVE